MPDSRPGETPPSEDLVPTRGRWQLLVFLFSLTVVLYVDRVCISQAALLIERDLGIFHTEMGMVFAAFTIAYGLFEVPTGRWGDKYGSRGVLARIVLWWSVFTILTGCVWRFSVESDIHIRLPVLGWSSPLLFDSFLLLLLIRFLFGAGEAGALPNVARVTSAWYPFQERPLVQGVILMGMSLGGAVSPVITSQLIEVVGWRWSFGIFGVLGFVWTALFYRWFRDDPAVHPSVNAAELMLISRGKSDTAPKHEEHPPIPWGQVLSSLNVWLMGSIITTAAFCSYLYLFWYTTYLQQGRGVEAKLAGKLTGMVLLGSALGCFLGGFLAKWAATWRGGRKWGRRWVGFASLSTAAAFLWLSIHMKSPEAAAGCAALVGLATLCQQANWWAAVTETSGPHLGALFGLLNSLGVPGAMSSQLFMGWFADYRRMQGFTGREQWDPAFYIYAVVLLAGGLLWLFVNVDRPIVRDERGTEH